MMLMMIWDVQIEDLKSYFDEPEEAVEKSPDPPEADSPELFMLNRASLKSKQDLMDLLPQRHVADRLIMRYFSAHSASQRKPTTHCLLRFLITDQRTRYRPQTDICEESRSIPICHYSPKGGLHTKVTHKVHRILARPIQSPPRLACPAIQWSSPCPSSSPQPWHPTN